MAEQTKCPNVYGKLSKITYLPWSNYYSSIEEFGMTGRFPGFDFEKLATSNLKADMLELVVAHIAMGKHVSSGPEIVVKEHKSGPGLCMPCVASTEMNEESIKHLDHVIRLVHTHWMSSMMKEGKLDLPAVQKMFHPMPVVAAKVSSDGTLVITTTTTSTNPICHYSNWVTFESKAVVVEDWPPTQPVRYELLACLDPIDSHFTTVSEIWIPKGHVGTRDAKENAVPADHSWRLNHHENHINLTEAAAPANGVNRKVPSPLTMIELPQTLIIQCNELFRAQDVVCLHGKAIASALKKIVVVKMPPLSLHAEPSSAKIDAAFTQAMALVEKNKK